nr:DUF2971 domain-containing protein [uncultured Hyphomonas sp.]
MSAKIDSSVQLFRYRPISEYLWHELEMAQIYASSVEALNDPFDCQFDPMPIVQRAIGSTASTKRKTDLELIRASFKELDPRSKSPGVCCFTLNLDSQLMWSHYAQNHTGVCLLYEFPSTYISDFYPAEVDGFFQVGLARVQYGDDAYFSWLTGDNLNDPIIGNPVLSAAAKTLMLKAQCWEYEQEVRLIMSKPGLVQLEHAHLKQVTFGLRTAPRHIDLIKRTVSRLNSETRFSQSVVDPSSDYKLDFNLID